MLGLVTVIVICQKWRGRGRSEAWQDVFAALSNLYLRSVSSPCALQACRSLRIESYGVVAATAGEEAALGCRVFPSESATVGQCAFLSRGTIAPAWVGGERVTQASLALSARKMSVTFSAERSRRKQEMKPTRSDHRGQNAVTSAVTLARQPVTDH